jgi:hypothetical protein
MGAFKHLTLSAFSLLRIGTSGCSCEPNDEPSGSSATELVYIYLLTNFSSRSFEH